LPFYNQVKEVSERFGCKGVTFVGDRGMIKSTQDVAGWFSLYHGNNEASDKGINGFGFN